MSDTVSNSKADVQHRLESPSIQPESLPSDSTQTATHYRNAQNAKEPAAV
jgi:hypothetical protein